MSYGLGFVSDRLWLGSLERNGNFKAGTSIGFGVALELAIMLFDDNLIGDRQPQPCALADRFGCKEGIKNPRSLLLRNTNTIVGDRHDNIRANQMGFDRNTWYDLGLSLIHISEPTRPY